MAPSRAAGSIAPLLALAPQEGSEPAPQLLDRALKNLPKAPAEVLVLSRSVDPLSRQLRAAGFATTELSAERDPASSLAALLSTQASPRWQAVLVVEGFEPLSDPANLVEGLLALLQEGGVFLFLDIVTRGPSDEPGSLAALETILGRCGVALSPPEDLSEEARTSAHQLIERQPQEPEPKHEQGPPQALQKLLQGLVSGDSSYFLLRGRKTTYSVRAHQPGDERGIANLFERSFHQRRGEEHWRWEYLENPWGGPAVTVALDEQRELVAHYAGYPMRFLEAQTAASPKVLSAYQIGDTMTAPRVRHVGRGPTSLLARTARHFYARFSTQRVAFNYGFNEGNIRRFSELFLDARFVEPVPFHQRVLAAGSSPFRPPSFWRRVAQGETISSVKAPPAECDALLHQVLPTYGLLTQRDSAYLQWRYFDRPDYRYWMFAARRKGRLKAWAIFRREGGVLLLGDLLVDPEEISLLEPIIATALASAVGEGAQRIEGWFPDRPAFLAAELRRLGFERRPEPQDLALMCLAFQDAHPEILLREKLFYTSGDSDLF